MRILRIEHEGFLKKHSNVVTRHAIRALSVDQGKLLMVLSSRVGDYKFAGGAAHDGETASQTLFREVLEETGYHINMIGGLIFRTEEYRNDSKNNDTCFVMISDYYFCSVHPRVSAQKLDAYEAELGFLPVWISAEEALQINNEIFESKGIENPPWLLREIKILEALCETDCPSHLLLKP